MQIIAMVGFIGSGKDSVAKYLVENCDFQDLAFADPLKDAVAAIFCWDRVMLEGETGASRVWRETVDTWWAERLGISHLTPRWVLQNFGTETVRKHFNQDIWLHNVARRIDQLCLWNELNEDVPSNIVITDARFPNELDLARHRGGIVVRVRRGEEPEWYEIAAEANTGSAVARNVMCTDYKHVHESEWAWIGSPVDYTIDNDGSLDDLHRAARCLIQP